MCRVLAARGWKVRAFVRNPVKAAAILADIPLEMYGGDVRDADALAAAISGAGSVVHLAAIAIERGRQTYESVNTEATRILLDTARSSGAGRFIFMSQNGASPESESSFLRSKGEAEQAVRDSGLEWTVLRPSVIFGPEDEFVNVLGRLAKLSLLILPLPDGGRARFQPIAVGDVAQTVAVALERRNVIRGVYALGGPATLTLREMTERALLAMRVRREIVGVPRQWLRPLIAIMQRILPSPPVTTTLLDLLGQDNVVPDNTLSLFGVTPTPFAPEELAYLRRITAGDALRALFR